MPFGDEGAAHRLCALLKGFSVEIQGFRPIAEAIVTAGGVSLKEVSPQTMESKLVKGLYFAGRDPGRRRLYGRLQPANRLCHRQVGRQQCGRRINPFPGMARETVGIERFSEKEVFLCLQLRFDGPAGAGKSSVAKAAARELGFVYVDTGALYRTIALYVLRQGVDPHDAAKVEALLPEIHIGMEYTEQGQKMVLNGEDVTGLIRTPEVSMATSTCSAIPAVRAYLLQLQRDLAEQNNVLMDGRDIGTVVLPKAQLKVFLTASPEERARRRVRQLEESGQKADYESILRDIEQRDYQDSHRETAPLRPAEDSVLLDTSEDSFERSVERLVGLVRERL